MKSHDEIRESLIPFALGQLSQEEASDITRHLAGCQKCGAEVKQLGKILECARQTQDLTADEQLCKSAKETILAAAQEAERSRPIPTTNMQNVRRIIMKSRIAKLAAAAAIIIASGLVITFVGTTEPAYALPQTIKANHSVRYLHMVNYVASQDEPMEFWVEFDSGGQLKNMRLHKPAW
ncbi:MAG: anti-sigma factor family protein, partial [Planctomycetota bacterium]